MFNVNMCSVPTSIFLSALAPEIIDPPRSEATVDGRTVTLICHVFGAPKPLVKWIHGGVELTGGRYSVLDSGDLEIRCVEWHTSYKMSTVWHWVLFVINIVGCFFVQRCEFRGCW